MPPPLPALPLFVFSTTFYPLSTYPGALRVVVRCTPLYHGIELIRGLVTGEVGWSLLVLPSAQSWPATRADMPGRAAGSAHSAGRRRGRAAATLDRS